MRELLSDGRFRTRHGRNASAAAFPSRGQGQRRGAPCSGRPGDRQGAAGCSGDRGADIGVAGWSREKLLWRVAASGSAVTRRRWCQPRWKGTAWVKTSQEASECRRCFFRADCRRRRTLAWHSAMCRASAAAGHGVCPVAELERELKWASRTDKHIYCSRGIPVTSQFFIIHTSMH